MAMILRFGESLSGQLRSDRKLPTTLLLNLWAAEMVGLGYVIFWNDATVSTLASNQTLIVPPILRESAVSDFNF